MDPRPSDPEARRPDSQGDEARRLFLEHLRTAPGGEADFEAFAAGHAEHADALRRLRGAWQRARTELRVLGLLDELEEDLLADSAETLPTERLKEQAGEPADPEGFLRRVTRRRGDRGRYRGSREVARGGMGAILRVWDRDFHRQLAMKVLLHADLSAGALPPGADQLRALTRFLEEAQITGQLDHPGIVPVHDLGIGADGRAYFTMKLVKGEDFRRIVERVHGDDPDWTLARALQALLRVCEAMSYAHDKGVLHRDLKPGNIMVGRFGEVYVMDWGLARVLGTPETKDIRVRAMEEIPSQSFVYSDRRAREDDDLESPVITMDGDVVGTPVFMSPEQAAGRLDRIGPRSDVYALGAILYFLLSNRKPYVEPGVRISARTVLALLSQGPPKPLHEIAPRVPMELCAICERAMARDPEQRYSGMKALAADLQAYLEGRVVHAFQTGAVAEFKKWMVRNRAVAASIGVGAALTLGALTTTSVVQARSSAREERAKLEAQEKARMLQAALDAEHLEEHAALADQLWPPYPALIPAFEDWLAVVSTLRNRLQEHREALQGAAPRPAAVVPSDQDVTQRQYLDALLRIERFVETGKLVEDVERRLARAREIGERSLTSPEARARWADAIEAVADVERHPEYGGLSIAPQVGLLPLGPDPVTNLWEFAHLLSGQVLERGEDGRLRVTEESGLVLVLLPSGRYAMGAQSTDPDAPNYDRLAVDADEGPVCEIDVPAFFVSKHEMTQAQWLRATGENPSEHRPGNDNGRTYGVTGTHPVENVTWFDCERVLFQLGLELPWEAQWEYAARAGTSTPWISGDAKESVGGFVNLADVRTLGRLPSGKCESWLDDGYVSHAPVGTFRPNAFGLHEVIGNVWEWCRDAHRPNHRGIADGVVDPLNPPGGESKRTCRGGGVTSNVVQVRSSHREGFDGAFPSWDLGVRPVRALDPR